MFQHLRRTALDAARWDELITQAPNGLIYALSWYLDIVSPDWEALVRVEDGRYVAGLPLPVRRKFGLRYLQQPPFAQQLGLFARQPPTPADWQQVGQQLRRFRFITRYAFNTGNSDQPGLDQLGLPGAWSLTYHLPLARPYEVLRAGYRPTRRRRTRQAEQSAPRPELTTDVEALARLFADNTAGRIYGVGGESYEYPLLRALHAAAAAQAGSLPELGAIWQVRAAGTGLGAEPGAPGAMLLLWRFRGQLTYLFGSSSPAGRAQHAATALLDGIIRHYAGQPDLTLDFEAPPVPDLVRFYASFGAVPVRFWTVTLEGLPWPLRQLRAARAALYRRLRPRPPGQQ